MPHCGSLQRRILAMTRQRALQHMADAIALTFGGFTDEEVRDAAIALGMESHLPPADERMKDGHSRTEENQRAI